MAFEKVSLQTWLDFNNNNKNKEVFFKTTEENYSNITIPSRSTSDSAGYDFKFPFDSLLIKAGVDVIIPTGIKANLGNIAKIKDKDGNILVQLPVTLYLALYPRSSFGFKYGFTLLNTTGIIDSDYYNNKDNEGHIMIGFKTTKDLLLEKGTKFCQGIITPYFVMENDVSTTVRLGGIGSTGE